MSSYYNRSSMASLRDVLWLVVVSALWGGTNPLIKRAGSGVENIRKSTAVAQFLAELKFLVFNWRYVGSFLLNQSGSLLFYLSLAKVDISLAVPLTNSLTFLFTTLASRLLGEKIKRQTYMGVLLVTVGVTLCVYSKLQIKRGGEA